MRLPLRLNDLLLLVVVLSSMAAGIIFPGFSSRFQELPVYCLMILFALSYLSIELKTVRSTLRNDKRRILAFVILKSLIFPALVYYLFQAVAPAYALAALLLSGVSTGVVAPFISNLVKGNSALVLVVVVITSVLVPVTLPVLVQLVASRQAEISMTAMIRMLLTVIFVPILIVEALRLLAPGLLKQVIRVQFPLSLVLFALINLGIFSRHSALFRTEPAIIFTAAVAAVGLSAICCAAGILFFRRGPLEDQLAGAVMMGNMNNVLVIVFASAFFGPLEPLVSAMYIIPFFGLVMPLRYYAKRRAKAVRN